MRIALDYDGTYTRDPGLWDRFIADAQARGHDVVCVTMRTPEQATDINIPVPVIATSLARKAGYCLERGRQFDVWVDDRPEFI